MIGRDGLRAWALRGIPEVRAGEDVSACITAALAATGERLQDDDVVVITSKLLSKAEGRRVRLEDVSPGEEAVRLAARTGKDARLVELVLRESVSVSRVRGGVLVTRHRLGFVGANAGIDASNTGSTEGEVLLLPADPDTSARHIRATLQATHGVRVAVLVTDSLGRPFRLGTVGIALGLAGLPAVWDQRGRPDRGGRVLQHTYTALADQLAAVADLVSGQADEGTPVTILRGLTGVTVEDGPGAAALVRPAEEDLYA